MQIYIKPFTSWKVYNLVTYQVPDVCGQPVNIRTNTADQVQVFSFAFSLADQVDDKTGRNKG